MPCPPEFGGRAFRFLMCTEGYRKAQPASGASGPDVNATKARGWAGGAPLAFDVDVSTAPAVVGAAPFTAFVKGAGFGVGGRTFVSEAALQVPFALNEACPQHISFQNTVHQAQQWYPPPVSRRQDNSRKGPAPAPRWEPSFAVWILLS